MGFNLNHKEVSSHFTITSYASYFCKLPKKIADEEGYKFPEDIQLWWDNGFKGYRTRLTSYSEAESRFIISLTKQRFIFVVAFASVLS